MATVSTQGVDALIAELQKRGEDVTEVRDEMLEAGGAVLVETWRSVGDAHGYRKSGAMLDSVAAERIGADTVEVKPRGNAPHGKKTVSNAYKAFLLHTGTSKIHGSHWVDEVTQQAAPKAEAAMRAIFDARMGGH